MNIRLLSILKNSKNWILINCIIEKENGDEYAWWITLYNSGGGGAVNM